MEPLQVIDRFDSWKTWVPVYLYEIPCRHSCRGRRQTRRVPDRSNSGHCKTKGNGEVERAVGSRPRHCDTYDFSRAGIRVGSLRGRADLEEWMHHPVETARSHSDGIRPGSVPGQFERHRGISEYVRSRAPDPSTRRLRSSNRTSASVALSAALDCVRSPTSANLLRISGITSVHIRSSGGTRRDRSTPNGEREAHSFRSMG